MILFHQPLAQLFGTNHSKVFWIVGLVLIYFAMTIWYEIGKQRKWAVIWIIIQDYAWVLGSLMLLLFNPFGISIEGNVLIGIIALIVLYMGINQMIGLKNNG